MTPQQPQDPSNEPPSWPAPPEYPTSPQGAGMSPASADGGIGRLIPTKNAKALIAYYLAVFSLIPCFGLVLGIAAFVLGLQGLAFAKQHPEVHGKTHAWVGIILGGLCGLGNLIGLVTVLVFSHRTS